MKDISSLVWDSSYKTQKIGKSELKMRVNIINSSVIIILLKINSNIKFSENAQSVAIVREHLRLHFLSIFLGNSEILIFSVALGVCCTPNHTSNNFFKS